VTDQHPKRHLLQFTAERAENLIPSVDTNALNVQAATLGLLPVVAASVAHGSYLNTATQNEPVAVLGAQAAQFLGIDRVFSGERIWIDNQWFYVVGILNPAVLAPEIDTSVLVGFPAAENYLGFDGHPSEIYLRCQQDQVDAVDSVLGPAADPEDPGEVKHLAVQLKDGLRAALDDLRALARGIYPPLLAEQGLRAALRAHADRVPVPVLVEADGIGRYRRDTEATAYFCILEALQNVAKYARASRATVALACPDGHLEFTVADDGVGFDAVTATAGTGLQGMADRVAAVGGSLRVRSAPGTGTAVHGRLPL